MLSARAFRNALPLLAIAFVSFLNAQFGELTMAGDGVGWDGRVYADVAIAYSRSPGSLVGTLSGYRLQRQLPSVIVATSLQMIRVPVDYANLVRAFRWYNFVLICAALYYWYRIARQLRLTRQMTFLGASCLFLTFPLLKMCVFVPITTDVTAVFLSTLLLYCYLTGRRGLLFATAIAAAFSWPPIFWAGLVFLIWPYSDSSRDRSGSNTGLAPATDDNHSHSLAAVILGVVALGLSLYWLRAGLSRPVNGYAAAVLPLSVTCSAAFLHLGLTPLVPPISAVAREVKTALRNPMLYGSVALFGCAYTAIRALKGADDISLVRESMRMAVENLAKPGVAVLSSVLYFGPVVLFAMYRWSRVCRMIRRYGFGLSAVVIVWLLQALLDSETRRVLPVLPVLVAFTAAAYNDLRMSRAWSWVVVGLCCISSKAWLLVNQFGQPATEPMSAPLQYLFASLGPWMSNDSYVAQGGIVLLVATALPLYWLADHHRPVEPEPIRSGKKRTTVASAA